MWMHPAEARFGLPEWKAMPPSAKNVEYGIGAGCPLGRRDSRLLWSLSFRYTRSECAIGVGFPLPPEAIFIGPRVTLPSWISHACWLYRSTQARAETEQGVPAARGSARAAWAAGLLSGVGGGGPATAARAGTVKAAEMTRAPVATADEARAHEDRPGAAAAWHVSSWNKDVKAAWDALPDDDKDYFDNLLNTLPDAYQALARQGIYGDFFSFYLCDIVLKLNGKGGQPVYVKVAGQSTGRCAPR